MRRVVPELHNHMPRIVENQQRLGPIVGQLASITTAWIRMCSFDLDIDNFSVRPRSLTCT
jgi:hypothetical protein